MKVDYYLANEMETSFENDLVQFKDRQLFVKNLGILLSQTREGIKGAYLDDMEIVHVQYRNGFEEHINVNMDSYIAIIKDVVNRI